MSDPFLAEIRMFAGNFAPQSWATCDGQLLPISQNQALYSLLGTSFGGDGQVSFGLPNLRGRTPISSGQGLGLANRSEGQTGGMETVQLTSGQIPAHTHEVMMRCNSVGGAGTTTSPVNNFPTVSPELVYSSDNQELMADLPQTDVVGDQSHENMSPFLVVNFIIALQGVFPSPN